MHCTIKPPNLSHDTHTIPLDYIVYFVQYFNTNASGPFTGTTHLNINMWNYSTISKYIPRFFWLPVSAWVLHYCAGSFMVANIFFFFFFCYYYSFIQTARYNLKPCHDNDGRSKGGVSKVTLIVPHCSLCHSLPIVATQPVRSRNGVSSSVRIKEK